MTKTKTPPKPTTKKPKKTEAIPEWLGVAPASKPGPTKGFKRETSSCPYCGGTAHRKAKQTLKGLGTYRRMYCADGCGHYHYRDVDTHEVVKVGKGPREVYWSRSGTVEQETAKALGIDVAELAFTSIVEGRPRAIVNCLSEDDLAALPTDEDRETVRKLQTALLTVQACLKVYRARVQGKGK